jgi:hypothetical protein
MGRRSGKSNGEGCLIGAVIFIIFLDELLPLVVIGVAIWVLVNWPSGDKVKTVTRSRGLFGERRTHIEYHDTGKEVDIRTSKGFFGGSTSEYYVSDPSVSQTQHCFRCGAEASSSDRRFTCPQCGRRWGRR